MIFQEECSRSYFNKIDLKEQMTTLRQKWGEKTNFSGLGKIVLKKGLIF